MDKRIEKTMKNLKKNNITAYYANAKEDALELVRSMLKKGETVACGGSVTLRECGVRQLLACGDYNFIDSFAGGLTHEEAEERFRKSFFADTYLSSSNAITEDGELYNVDGNSNRVAALLYGPSRVIIVAGANKIVKDFDEAVKRVKTIAAPKNSIRLNCDTYCFHKGHCVCDRIGGGCFSDRRMCCSYAVLSFQRVKNRINVIICKEQLGY